ncbi:nitrate reductase [Paraferrimonas sp. SM1919]|uniref:nitrate reductase n=1 Tax=Paraferrimonas sp. SM1919 TaxID=2662263 RepID=UPI0013D09CD0|nr:nitrate reductase [Paraferrimonas sp. SM1919]
MQNQSPWTKTTCAYCGVGCGIEAKVNLAGKLELRGDASHPANLGALCSKGRTLADSLTLESRLLYPSINGQVHSWAESSDFIAKQFKQIVNQHGADAIAFYVSGQLLTEDYYVANKLLKGFIGSGNIDTNSRLCMSSAVAGHKRAFGFDSVSGCYQDLELCDLLVLVGSNLAWCHPILFQRIKTAKENNPKLKVIVIDPRHTPSCEIADLHLSIKANTDVALFNGLLAYLALNHHIDTDYIEQYTQGFDEALLQAKSWADIHKLAQYTDIGVAQLQDFFDNFATTAKAVTIFSQGVNQSLQGTDKVNSIINCHLATGKFAKPGATAFSVTGQPNAMGGREVGGLSNMLAAHMDFDDPQAAKLVSQYWQASTMASKPGLKAVEMFEQVASGKIKAIWIMGTNPVVSMPNSDYVAQALEKCPLVIVSDVVKQNDTLAFANVKLPAQGWGEKSGTVTNSERCISRQRKLVSSPGAALPDWKIIVNVAKAMGFGEYFDYQSEADIFREHCGLTAFGQSELFRDLNLAGLKDITDEQYQQFKPSQWPILTMGMTTQRLFTDNQFFTATGRANFVPTTQNQAIMDSSQFPFLLNSGRVRDHWHTLTRTGLVNQLSNHYSEPLLHISETDAQALNFSSGQLVSVVSQQQKLVLKIQIDKGLRAKELFMPIHWSNSNSSGVNPSRLTQALTDPISGQPQLKATPVRLENYSAQSQALLATTKQLDMKEFDYWVVQTIAGGFLYQISSRQSVMSLQQYLDEVISEQLGVNKIWQHQHFSRSNKLFFQEDKLCANLIVATKLTIENQFLEMSLDAVSMEDLQLSLLKQKGCASLSLGPIVCSCKQVRLKQITDAIEQNDASSVNQLGNKTGAGRGCGSCIGQLQQILDEVASISY